jgi:hypothetical protein
MASNKLRSTAQVAGHPIHPMLVPFRCDEKAPKGQQRRRAATLSELIFRRED